MNLSGSLHLILGSEIKIKIKIIRKSKKNYFDVYLHEYALKPNELPFFIKRSQLFTITVDISNMNKYLHLPAPCLGSVVNNW